MTSVSECTAGDTRETDNYRDRERMIKQGHIYRDVKLLLWES